MGLRVGIFSVIGIYVAANGFVAFRGWKWMREIARNSFYPGRWKWIGNLWVILVLLLMALPFLGRGMGNAWLNFLPGEIASMLALAGYDWMAGGLVLAVFLLVSDGIFCLMQRIFVFRGKLRLLFWRNGLALLGMGVFLAIGTQQALHFHWTPYEITLASAVQSPDIKVVCVSDLHLGELIHSDRLREWVQAINAKEPDMICLAGDIFDRGYASLGEDEEACRQTLAELSAPLGVYACIGNHDLGFRGNMGKEQLAVWLDTAGIRLLLNEYVDVGGLIVAGKDYLWEEPETALDFLEGIPEMKPVFLLDHKPGLLADYETAGVDLVFSGHTHQGQIFPGNLITSYLYETDYGYRAQENSQIAVSCGVGTWGPLLRMGSQSELVELQLHFSEETAE